jgi:serine/threonine protein kinase/class 3 adenylate cyclase
MPTTIKDAPPTTALDEKVEQRMNTLTVMVTEIVDPVVLFSQCGESAALQVIQGHEQVTAGIIEKHAGKVITKRAGSVVAEFSNPASSVRAAMEIERALQESHLTVPPEKQLEIQIGIHASTDPGRGMDVFGNVVNVAAKITKHASPMQILVSSAISEALLAETGLHCRWFSNVTIDGQTKDLFEVNCAEAPSNIPSRYEVLSQVGTGGMGIVYKARDVETGEIVALKILKPDTASDSKMQENLKREVCLARKVTHKNVCRIHEFNRSNGAVCISMEFVEGESLQSRLRQVGSLPLNDARRIMLQICAGLREAHLQGIVHRDLKPANIMLDRSGRVKIMDFGIARSFQGSNQTTGTMIGTPAYMAPEQLELKPIAARTDVYALGLLLYEMVTGVSVFVGDTPVSIALKQLRELPKRPRDIVPTLPAHIEAAILKCLQKDPAKRFQSVDGLELALKKTIQVRAPWWSSFALQLQRAERELVKVLQISRREVQQAIVFLRGRDWRTVTKIRKQHALAAGLVFIFAGMVALALGNSRKNHATVLAAAETSAPSTQKSVPAAPAASASSDPNSAAPADASDRDPIVATNTTGVPTAGENPDQSSDAESETASSSSVDASEDSHGVGYLTAPISLKAPSRAHRSTNTSVPAAQTPAKIQPSAASSNSPKSAAVAGTASSYVPADSKKESPTPASTPTAVAPDPKSKPASVTAATNATAAKPDSSAGFLDVGSFKEPAWADSAVDKLTQLGFHAVSVRKVRLFMPSYHVQVGPFATPKDIEAAQQTLASHGFEAHVVK